MRDFAPPETADKVKWVRAVLLGTFGLLVVNRLMTLPVSSAQSARPVTTPKIEAASIRRCDDGTRSDSNGGGSASPGRLIVECTTLGTLPDSFPGILQQAYGLYANGHVNHLWSIPTIEGGPAWINTERYEINMKAEANASVELMMGPLMQTLLEDRFKLKIHRETREVPVYALTVVKGGPRLKPFREGSCTPSTPSETPPVPGQPPVCRTFASSKGSNDMTLDGQGMTLDEFSGVVLAASAFGFKLDRPLINKTGIAGRFDFHLEFTIDDLATAPDAVSQSIFTAIEEQLGLKLAPAKGPGEFLVIDSVDRPSEN